MPGGQVAARKKDTAPDTGAQLICTLKNDMNTEIWSRRPWKYSGSSTSWMITTLPSAGAVIR